MSVIDMSVIDEIVHPQGIFVGWAPNDDRLKAMQALVAGSLVLRTGDLGQRRPLDYDIWVQRGDDGDATTVPDHMHVLALGIERSYLVHHDETYASTFLRYGIATHSPTMSIASGLPEEVNRLVKNELVPWLQSQPFRPALVTSMSTSSASVYRPVTVAASMLEGVVPFVLDADDNVIAGAFRRSGYVDSWVWVLPHDPPRPELWLAAALQDWHERTPDRVPVAHPWQQRATWMSRAEAVADCELARLEARRLRWETLYAERREQLETDRLHARAEANKGVRRLLTGQGEELVEAVTEALHYLGFEVVDEDAQRLEDGRSKAHDLNVVDPDRPEASVIAEVKGFKKGPRGALTQAQRHILRYATTHQGKMPDKCWLIVNQFRETDPDERPPMLQGADEDIAGFAEIGGVLMDSRDLFTLRKQVEEGRRSTADARRALMESSARLAIAVQETAS